jgi:hypothetical protein
MFEWTSRAQHRQAKGHLLTMPVLVNFSVGIDIIDGGEFNESNAAGQGNNVAVGTAVNQVVSALPAQYETPIRVVGEVITTVSSALFNEASSNEDRSDNRE